MTTTKDRPVLYIDETDLEANLKNGLVKVVKKPKPVLEVVRGGK